MPIMRFERLPILDKNLLDPYSSYGCWFVALKERFGSTLSSICRISLRQSRGDGIWIQREGRIWEEINVLKSIDKESNVMRKLALCIGNDDYEILPKHAIH